MADQNLLDKVKKHVIAKFQEQEVPGVLFHNLDYTNSVVKAVKKISVSGNLSKKELILLEVAAWFHNIGYLENTRDCKQHSAKLARNFLNDENVAGGTIKRVTDLIMATRENQQPSDALEQIMYDAGFYYWSKPSFTVKNELLRKETEFLSQKEITPEIWNRDTIKLMEDHQYLTNYCRTEITAKKNKNLEELKAMLLPAADEQAVAPDQQGKKAQKERSKVEVLSEKGIETLFRIASSNHQKMFTLADNKAHILITVNSIILSVTVSVLVRKLTDSTFLIWPTFLLLGISVTSTAYAILATRPRFDNGTFTQEDLENKQVNLMNFGSFHQMTFDDYMKGMEIVLADRLFVYQTLIRDAYWHGRILGKKYLFLRKAYNIFLFGLIISIAAFVVAFLLHQHFQSQPALLPQ